MLERRKQIRTQTSLLLADSIKIASLKQERKKTLREILCLLGLDALSPYEGINRSPVSATKFFECLLLLRAMVLAPPAPRSNAW